LISSQHASVLSAENNTSFPPEANLALPVKLYKDWFGVRVSLRGSLQNNKEPENNEANKDEEKTKGQTRGAGRDTGGTGTGFLV
jgi:hypothetical protein